MAFIFHQGERMFKIKIYTLTVAVLHRSIQLWLPSSDETTLPELRLHTGVRSVLISTGGRLLASINKRCNMEIRPCGNTDPKPIKLSKVLQNDAEQERDMRAEIQEMKKEHNSVSMMDEFARYARLERKINKMTDKLKTHVKSRTAQQAKMKWMVNIGFYILQAALMISLIWKYYADPVTVVPSKWIAPLERLVAFPSGVAGGVGITCWLVVCNKVVSIGLHAVS
ncbi:guided entry of tail-anchored proteins factor 1 isoform X1 [Coregonus clupeaformis]|uniref:guided entry of tail-anchored proteins factor 1 isoform X1 n=1 Tax=Coregonus clupeaformis TaxID=59861 RepID=UPI001BDFCAD1|nr:guided entry of tail-anchored proteins factor 1 isoform X1 [Coregonus clupeaformis]